MIRRLRRLRRLLLGGLFAAAFPAQAFFILDQSLEQYAPPVAVDASALPAEYADVAQAYAAGQFRLCVLKLKPLLSLELPDGRSDGYLFIAAECYHQLRLDKFARQLYRRVAEEYPQSHYRKFSLYRLQEDAYFRSDAALSEAYYNQIQKEFPGDPLQGSSIFLEAKRQYKRKNIAETEKLSAAIPKSHDLYYAAAFLRGLCAVLNNDIEKAVLTMDGVGRNGGAAALREEAQLILADLYHKLKRDSLALAVLAQIPPESEKYHRTLLVKGRFFLERGDLATAVSLGEALLTRDGGAYMFEAALVLEPAYLRQKRVDKMRDLRAFLELKVRQRKLIFDFYRELDYLSERQSGFGYFYQTAYERLRTPAARERAEKIFSEVSDRIQSLKAKNMEALRKIDREGYVAGKTGIYDLRFLEILTAQETELTARADSLSARLSLLSAQRDTALLSQEKALGMLRTALLDSLRAIKEIRYDISTYTLWDNDVVRSTEEVQAKFVDWNLLRLNEMKGRLLEIYRELGADVPDDAAKLAPAAPAAPPEAPAAKPAPPPPTPAPAPAAPPPAKLPPPSKSPSKSKGKP